MKFKKNNQGFSLVELILVLGLSSLIFIGVLSLEKRKAEAQRAESAGEQLKEIGTALNNYIYNQKSNLNTNIPAGATVELPLQVLQGVTFGVFNGKQYLPATFNSLNAFGTGYKIQIRNNSSDSLTGLVITDAAITDDTGAVRYDWLGYAAKAAGAQAGMSFFTPSTITGLNAGWALSDVQFSTINAAGKLAYRSQYQGETDSLYLRRDGMYPMNGNLNMGNHNIKDATDINFYGYLNGNNALLNNLQTGYILNNGNIQNNGTISTLRAQGYGISGYGDATNNNVVGALGNDTAEFTRYVARYDVRTPFINRDGGDVRIGNGDSGKLYVKDIYITGATVTGGASGTTNRTINGWLSDRLPRMVSRGSFTVGNGSVVTKPACGSGIAKLEVIPQKLWVQSRVYGMPTLNKTDLGGGNMYYYLTPGANEYAVGGFDSFATDNGGSWTVSITTPQYDTSAAPGSYQGYQGIAHVYCDMGGS